MDILLILAILQARLSSSRLPGKVLKPILGKPMILLQIERVSRSKRINKLLIATSTDPSDDRIFDICTEHGIACFRGDLNDVLDRFYQAAKTYKPRHIVRLTGDCPLIDSDVVDKVIELHLSGGFDYTSNTVERTFPKGLDVSIFTMQALEEAWREAYLSSQREHVTQFIISNSQRYKIGSYKNSIDLSSLRWTVDKELYFILINKIYNALYYKNLNFKTADILALIEKHPELKTLNVSCCHNDGLKKTTKSGEV